ncbi:MAG: DUF177 domain-containing protein [Candidatus Aureabacteria bacterium]|nr:DUF177 domain-containing protein [Candidatus Auribacterota bacterium]
MAKELIINLKRIREHSVILETEVSPADMELDHPDYIFSDPVFVKVSVQIISHEILVEGSVRFIVKTACSRCLEPISREMAIGSIFFSYEYHEQDFLDITSDIRDELYLSLPIRILCSESCRGLCAGCKKNLNRETCVCTGINRSSPFSHLDFDWKTQKGE